VQNRKTADLNFLGGESVVRAIARNCANQEKAKVPRSEGRPRRGDDSITRCVVLPTQLRGAKGAINSLEKKKKECTQGEDFS